MYSSKRKKVYNFIVVTKIGWFVLLLSIINLGQLAYFRLNEDRHCQKKMTPVTKMVDNPATSEEYLQQGDYEFESGNCTTAILNYDMAIRINPVYAEAYNNRAYVNMRLHNYGKALTDLNKAIEYRPNYPNALINRGDIKNYYFSINRVEAIEDYDRVIAMGKDVIKDKAVCGHRLMAKRNGKWLLAMWDILARNDESGCLKLYFE